MGTEGNSNFQNPTRGAVLSAAVGERAWPMIGAEGRGQALTRDRTERAARHAGTPARGKLSPALSLGWSDSQSPRLSSAPSLGKAGIFASQR